MLKVSVDLSRDNDAKKLAIWPSAFGPECVKTASQTLAMISEDFIARIAHEAFYPR
jgi:hypothetical protein